MKTSTVALVFIALALIFQCIPISDAEDVEITYSEVRSFEHPDAIEVLNHGTTFAGTPFRLYLKINESGANIIKQARKTTFRLLGIEGEEQSIIYPDDSITFHDLGTYEVIEFYWNTWDSNDIYFEINVDDVLVPDAPTVGVAYRDAIWFTTFKTKELPEMFYIYPPISVELPDETTQIITEAIYQNYTPRVEITNTPNLQQTQYGSVSIEYVIKDVNGTHQEPYQLYAYSSESDRKIIVDQGYSTIITEIDSTIYVRDQDDPTHYTTFAATFEQPAEETGKSLIFSEIYLTEYYNENQEQFRVVISSPPKIIEWGELQTAPGIPCIGTSIMGISLIGAVGCRNGHKKGDDGEEDS